MQPRQVENVPVEREKKVSNNHTLLNAMVWQVLLDKKNRLRLPPQAVHYLHRNDGRKENINMSNLPFH